MKGMFQTISQKISSGKAKFMAGLLTYSMPLIALADEKTKSTGGIGGLPVHDDVHNKLKSGGSIQGDWITVVKGYIGQGGTVIALAVSLLAFLWISYAALAKFNECRLNKAEWSELGVLAVAAAALLVFITLLLTILNETVTGEMNFQAPTIK